MPSRGRGARATVRASVASASLHGGWDVVVAGSGVERGGLASDRAARGPPLPRRAKRLIKSPKLYWGDTGLALHLAQEDEPRGVHLENLVLHDLLVWRDPAHRATWAPDVKQSVNYT